VFAVNCAFAPPLLDLIGEDGGGFHFRGASRVGKTTALRVSLPAFGVARKTRKLHRAADAFEARFWSGINFDEFYDEPKVAAPHSMAALFEAGMTEWRRQTPPTGSPDGWGGPRDRIARQMQIALRGEVAKLGETRAIWNPLRTIGLCLGLFGTICGIMTSVAAAASEPTGDVRMALPAIAAALLPMALSVVTTGAAALMGDQTGK
jgi:biopolymer transport protein ExbB/TolQ